VDKASEVCDAFDYITNEDVDCMLPLMRRLCATERGKHMYSDLFMELLSKRIH
jgi:hypothetical protein